ncbi:hypothetical protein SESBI_08868 [Sesbania bispinosa]|nr:hypothetical protein SESBI_08868 [Sesbania bispinosa]
MGPVPRSDMKMNAIRSGIVVLGALAFGYLSIQIGFKPYLDKAQQQMRSSNLTLNLHLLRNPCLSQNAIHKIIASPITTVCLAFQLATFRERVCLN